MNIFKRIWYWFFPKPVVVDRAAIVERALEQRVKKEVSTQLSQSTRKVQVKRPRPPAPVPPPPPPVRRPQYDPFAAERRLREQRQRDEEDRRRRERDSGPDIVDIAVGVALGNILSDVFDSGSSSSDSCSSSDNWSGGGGESGGGGASSDW